MNHKQHRIARGGFSITLITLSILFFAADGFAQARGRSMERGRSAVSQQEDSTRAVQPERGRQVNAGESRSAAQQSNAPSRTETPSQGRVDRSTPASSRSQPSGGAATRNDRMQPETSRERDREALREAERIRRDAQPPAQARPQPQQPQARPQPAARPPAHVHPRPAPPPAPLPVVRASSRWSPRYLYRQSYYVRSGWGPFRRNVRVDVHTELRQRVRSVNRNRKVVDIRIERISLYERGRYVGQVNRIPGHLSQMRATIYRNGSMDLDRMIYIVGERRTGFELISTRQYRGVFYDHYRPGHRMQVGELDLYGGRVVPTNFSRLADIAHFDGYVPVPLLHHDDDWYFVHGFYDGRGYYFYDFGNYYAHAAPQAAPQRGNVGPRGGTISARGATGIQSTEPSYANRQEARHRLEQGADVTITREVEIRRMED